MTARLVLAAALCLLLAACWVGRPFYQRPEVLSPIPAGDYLSIELGENHEGAKGERMRVSAAPDGLTRIQPMDKAEEPSVMGFASLDAGEEWFVGWMLVEPGARDPDDDVAYFLLQRAGRSYRFFLPNCSDHRDLATAFGAVVEPDKKAALCRFADRKSLESALRAAIGKVDPSVELRPAAN